MKRIFRILALAILSFLTVTSTQAQFWMKSDKSLYFGDSVVASPMGLNFRDIPGFYWQCGSHFIKMDCTPANPRLAFTNDMVILDGQTYADVIELRSDATAKENIHTLNAVLPVLDSLRPLAITDNRLKTANGHESSAPVVRYALDVPSLEKSLPDVVSISSDGRKAVNYTALIPVMVSGLQELQARVESRQRQLDSLSALHASLSKTSAPLKTSFSPARNTYTLSYTLPKDARDAWIQICDASGREIQVINVTGTKQSFLNSALLASKGGWCSLIVDGTLIATEALPQP